MRIAAVAAVACTAMIGACGTSPTPRYYSLSVETPLASVPATTQPTLAVEAVTIPASIDRPQIVLSAGDNRLTISDGHRWGEPLKTGLAWTLAENLARATGNPSVSAYPQSASRDADYRVLVDVQRFDSTLDRGVALDALWSIVTAEDRVLYRGRARLHEPAPGDHAALVAAHSRALGRLAAEIAAVARTLPARP
jgi:hypothetical protein